MPVEPAVPTPKPKLSAIMGDLAGRKVFKVFNQDFIVDERYTVTKELGQGAYGIVWYGSGPLHPLAALLTS